ncbi:MAG: peptidoglycan DD-metalloendopeptidase family protein [Oscillospiraceae bacterium]|nr:peptidoglycan DD-metalloendopeptidase family protein [Oscillospiraceae bacterium]
MEIKAALIKGGRITGKGRLLRRVSAVALAGIITLSFTNIGCVPVANADYASQISELEEKQAKLSAERQELEALLAEYEQGVQENADYMDLYDRKMRKQEEEILNVKEQISVLNASIAQTGKEIDAKKAEIDRDIVEFKQRLRTIYMDGNDSIASMLVGSVDFYDILMRSELVERVSRHDKEMIDSLNQKITALNSEKALLETSITTLQEKRSEAEAILADLKATYDNHSEMKAWYEARIEAEQSKTDEMRAQEQEYEDELQQFIRAQQEENDRIREEEERVRRAEREERERAEREKREQEEAERKAYEAEQNRLRNERLQKQAEQEEADKIAEEQRRQNIIDAAEEQRERDAANAGVTVEYVDDGVNYGDGYDAQFDRRREEENKHFDDNFNDVDDFRRPEPEQRYESAPQAFDAPEVPPEFDDNSYQEYEEDPDDYSYNGNVSFIWPCPTVYNVTDGYGYRTVDEQGGQGEFHKGIDITKPGCEGERIVAAASGKVITASNTGNGYGIHVVIDHGGKLATLYAHMSDCTVSVGDYVEQGQTIGYIGSTGQAYGSHCHFEVRVNGQHTDPTDYVSM